MFWWKSKCNVSSLLTSFIERNKRVVIQLQDSTDKREIAWNIEVIPLLFVQTTAKSISSSSRERTSAHLSATTLGRQLKGAPPQVQAILVFHLLSQKKDTSYWIMIEMAASAILPLLSTPSSPTRICKKGFLYWKKVWHALPVIVTTRWVWRCLQKLPLLRPLQGC